LILLSSGGTAGGLTMIDQTPSHDRARKKRALPQSLTRDSITAHPSTLRAWTRGQPTSRRSTPPTGTCAANVLANPGALKQHLNHAGQDTKMEIHPIDQTLVDEHARRNNLRLRKLQVRYIWDDAVDVIAELDSDWGAYTHVSHIGLGA
jgi:hypothetical protein